MTSRPITSFTETTEILGTDYLPIVRPGETNLDDRNKKITYTNLVKDLTYDTPVDFAGNTLCTSGCSLGTKAFAFYAPQPLIELSIVIGFDLTSLITSGSKSIQVFRWNQTPNTNLTGRIWYADLPNTGGKINLTIDSTYRWISIFAKNTSKSNAYDGVCFTVSGNSITLLSF